MSELHRCLLITPASEVHTKSARVRRRFLGLLADNARDALRAVPGARLHAGKRRIVVTGPSLDEAAQRLARVFGVAKVRTVTAFGEDPDLEALVSRAAELARPQVRGQTFAARVHRRGGQSWGRMEAERALGQALVADAAGVDLDDPEVVVRVDAYGDMAYVQERAVDGPGGLPVGAQQRALALLSGGFDSAVAAWHVQRRGVPVEFVHAQLGCAAADHSAAVAHELWRRWGAGTRPRLWVLDFEPVRKALLDHAEPSLRQVLLKRLMVAAADQVATLTGAEALVTGDSLGQVSSQTLRHLALTEQMASHPVLRPLAGMDKQEIIAASRRLGLHDLSVRAREVCDLAEGPVAVAAGEDETRRAEDALPSDLVDEAVEGRRAVSVADWVPGMDPVPVSASVPADVPVLEPREALARADDLDGEPVAVTGRGAVHAATRLAARGRRAIVADGAAAGAKAAGADSVAGAAGTASDGVGADGAEPLAQAEAAR